MPKFHYRRRFDAAVHQACGRKVRYASKPPQVGGVVTYHCLFCNGWHRSTDRRPFNPLPLPRPKEWGQ
jgi:hypothetical protein